MRIGIDLDHVVYGFPEFFREFIPAMTARGHQIVCSSNHGKHREARDREIVNELGIDPDLIDWSEMPEIEPSGPGRHWSHKAPLADKLDFVFDDHAERIQKHTKTPIFMCPGKISADRGNLRR